jgi:hypothetical protein
MTASKHFSGGTSAFILKASVMGAPLYRALVGLPVGYHKLRDIMDGVYHRDEQSKMFCRIYGWFFRVGLHKVFSR